MMRTLFVACFLGLIACTGAEVIALDFNICPVCDCKPPSNTTHNPKLLISDDNEDCYCLCGVKEGFSCDRTGECHQGLYCTAPRGNTNKGICEDACSEPGHYCDTYERCMVLDNKPECSAQTFTCSSIVYRPLCTDDNYQLTNRCFYENYRKEKKEDGIDVHILGFGTCQDVLTKNQKNPSVHAGNTYNPLNAVIY